MPTPTGHTTINWGDGTVVEADTPAVHGTQNIATYLSGVLGLTHPYTLPGTYNIVITIDPYYGPVLIQTLVVTALPGSIPLSMSAKIGAGSYDLS